MSTLHLKKKKNLQDMISEAMSEVVCTLSKFHHLHVLCHSSYSFGRQYEQAF